MKTVCQFFHYTPSHDLQSLLRLPYRLVIMIVTQYQVRKFMTIVVSYHLLAIFYIVIVSSISFGYKEVE